MDTTVTTSGYNTKHPSHFLWDLIFDHWNSADELTQAQWTITRSPEYRYLCLAQKYHSQLLNQLLDGADCLPPDFCETYDLPRDWYDQEFGLSDWVAPPDGIDQAD